MAGELWAGKDKFEIPLPNASMLIPRPKPKRPLDERGCPDYIFTDGFAEAAPGTRECNSCETTDSRAVIKIKPVGIPGFEKE